MFQDFSTPKFEPLITSSETRSSGSDLAATIHARLGQPTNKAWLDLLDLLALVTTTLCFIASAAIINTRYPFAADLGYSNQIIAIGFLLGIMNQCLQRILPYCFLLIEARYGQSRLQNYEGLLRWSPFAPRFSWIWRTSLILLLTLPLGLGVAYKNFQGGMALQPMNTSMALYYPTGPPGMQDNINGQIIVSNATAPFLSATRDDIEMPADFFGQTHVYGFNTVLLSNISAASLDAPMLDRITALQQSLAPQTSVLLNASVRGTVVTYNSTWVAHRNDQSYWNQYERAGGSVHLYQVNSRKNLGYYLAVINRPVATTDAAAEWDDSWMFTGVSTFSGVNTSDLSTGSAFLKAFHSLASRYDARRHNCRGTWQITRDSVQITQGDCSLDPLPIQYQYYNNCQLDLLDFYAEFISQTLGDFGHTRNESQWRIPTHAVVLAAVYQTSIAVNQGFAPVQIGGPVWQAFPQSIRTNTEYQFLSGFYEQYNSSEHLVLQVPTIRATTVLYCVLAIQPVLTLLALCVAVLLYDVPIARSFGMVSVLAGVDRRTLGILEGATFSGKLTKPVGMSMKVGESNFESDAGASRSKIMYSIGDIGRNAKVRLRRVYE